MSMSCDLHLVTNY